MQNFLFSIIQIANKLLQTMLQTVAATIAQKVIFEIPLYFEPSIKLDKVTLEDGLLVIETLKRVEQTPPHHEAEESLRLATRDDPKIQ